MKLCLCFCGLISSLWAADNEVTTVVAGATPPGLEHQVDLMWKILPYRAIADSFGKKVASQYFGVQVMLGNNSGYPIQITAIGFQTPGAVSSPPLQNDPYNIPRGTIEREQQVGTRALFVNSLSGVAGVLTGVSGLFHNIGHKANFNLLVGLDSPATAALELVWPDKTVRYLIAMDTRAFRDAAIVPNNVPAPPILAFISREIVGCKHKAECEAPVKRVPYTGITRVERRKSDFDPGRIRDALGTLVIQGQPIQYLPRVNIAGNSVSVTTAPATGAPAAPTAAPPKTEATPAIPPTPASAKPKPQ